jgi:predicted metal-dependent phosphoesterase TrpH
MSKMGRADMQLHSDLGDGLASPEQILDQAERAGLDVIALTDHDDIRGSFVLRELAAKRASPVEIVTGIEVTTRSGHLLALFIEDELPMFAPLSATVAQIHALGGIAIVPHPLSYLTFSIGEGALRSLAAAAAECRVDGIELRNPSYAGRVRRARAAWLNEHLLHVAETGSSDAHHAQLVGTAWTDFPGRTAAELRLAIQARTTSPDGRHWTLREHLDGAARQQWRSMIRDPLKRARRRMGTRKKSGR